MTLKKILFSISLLCLLSPILAQEEKKDDRKIQEVITMEAPVVPPQPDSDGNIPIDTTPPKPMAADEILKRAINFMKTDTKLYIKDNKITTGTKAECVATFKYKPKELNPGADVEGTISMHLSIEAKEGKYRYTITKITHNANKTECTGGNVYNDAPACGSLKVPPDLWKRIKGEAFRQSGVLISDIKAMMKIPSSKPVNADEW
jgi:hypothetical protein